MIDADLERDLNENEPDHFICDLCIKIKVKE